MPKVRHKYKAGAGSRAFCPALVSSLRGSGLGLRVRENWGAGPL